MKPKILISKIFIFFISLIISSTLFYFRILNDKRLAILKREQAWHQLQEIIIKEVKFFRGNAGIVIKDLKTGWEITINEEEIFPAASVIKMPIMVSCFKAIKEGRINLDDKVKLRAEYITEGSGILKKRPLGSEYKIEDLITLMITISDNTATNILIKLLGFDYLNKCFKGLGLKETILRREMMDFKKRERRIENCTTAGDMAYLLEYLYYNKLITPQVSETCLELLKNQKVKDRIPRKLWPDAVVANKTGLEKNVCHDIGVIFTPKGDVLICVLTQGVANSKIVKKFISDIALQSYLYLQRLN